MAKRIEPLSSRAQIVDKSAAPDTAAAAAPSASSASSAPSPSASAHAPATLAQPRQLAPPKSAGGSGGSGGSGRGGSGGGKGSGGSRKKWTLWRKIVVTFQLGFVLALVVACIVGYFVYEKALVYYARAETYDLKKLDDLNVTSTFYDVNGEELGRIFVEDRIVLKPDQIPDAMRQAVMSAEDRRFYEHGAIDYWGIVRALRENLSHKAHGVQGGSTIEQQLAKHLIGDFSRTLDRKFLEAFVAIRLEQNLTKDQIMNYYLNRIYFGKGYFGVGAAARGYFGKEASQLTVPECALLAGIIRAPTSSSPRVDPQKAKWRRDATLRQMYESGYIRREDYVRYIETPVRVLPAKPSGLQSYVMAAAVKEMEQILSIEGTEEMPQGLTVRTNIDLHLQRAIEAQLNAQLEDIENAQQQAAAAAPPKPGVPAPAANAPPKPPLQGAALVADVATGRVLAWIGGRDFAKNQFDHISMAHRESGALLQPLLYGLGFDRLDLTPASMINASYIDPVTGATKADLSLGDPTVDLSKWFLTVQDALALGNKSAATRVGLQLKANTVNEWFHLAGLDGRVPMDKPNAFNPEPMTLGDVTSVYQVLANAGLHRKLKIIRSITSRTGEVMYDDTKPDHDDNRDELLNNLNDQQMTLTLQNALREGPARTLTRDYGFHSSIAGMPGYSEGYRDAWFVGFTPKLLTGVWVGYDDSRAIGSREVAVRSAVPLWGEVMRQTEARMQTGGAFPVPSALTKVEVDRSTGALRGLAGLAPAPGDIFVYLKKDQVDAAGSASGNVQIQPPAEWSDWLTTMFNQADETGLAPDQVMNLGDKRPNVIPALAEYKMPGLRGDILSSDNTVYATTASEKNLVLGWPQADDATTETDIVKWMRSRLNEVQQTLGSPVSLTDDDLLNLYRTQRYQPVMVMEDVTPAMEKMVENAGLEAKGFGFQTAPLRAYPHGTELSHVLGYLSRDQQRNRGKYLSGDVIYDRYKGAAGLEQVFNKDLTGPDGRFLISTTQDGYARSAAVAEPASYGNNVRLAIDSKMQHAVETAMAASPFPMKAAVLMDIRTGDVVAIASHPTFDPNIFVPTIAKDEWDALNTAQYNPLLDRTIHAEYPPGSQFKTVTSIAAMRAGVFDPNWVVHCTGYFDIGNVHMDLKNERGDVTYMEGLTHSYNTYFITLGLKVGRDILLDTARSLNLGSLTQINLPGELPGFIPDNESVKRVHGREFGEGDLANTSIGQGDVLVTPLQMADLMATIANGGTVYKPRLIKDIEDRNGNVVKDFPTETLRTVQFDPKWMPTLKAAMINVVDNGTATVVHRDDIKVAAKTGTAQVGSKEHRRQIAWLSGYWPADNPQYSFSVMVEGRFSDNHNDTEEGGLLGGVQAGQIVHDIMDILYPEPGKERKLASTSHHKDDDDDADKSANEDTAQASTATTDATAAGQKGDNAAAASAPAPATANAASGQ
ncbi:MAG: penicillin-binding transpeptidase domain-containing protein [Verrucomicrobiota bacterium]